MNLALFTPLTWVGAILGLIPALMIIYIGVAYTLAPEATARGFGFRSAVTADVIPWQHIKGARDIASGLIIIAMLVFFGPIATAVALLIEALIPLGDGLTIIRHRGRLSAAIGIHFSTVAVMIIAAVLLLI
jgi:hypothetical protein